MNTRSVKVAIIGSGLAGFMAYSVLRFRGLKATEIAIIGPTTHPAETWLSFVTPISQTSMRSESAAHFFPTDSPGLATIELFKHGNPWPLITSWFDRYHPTVKNIVEHISQLMKQMGYTTSHMKDVIGNIHRHGNTFGVFNEAGEEIVQAQHIIISVGHGYPSIPPAINEFNAKYPANLRVRHAFATGAPIMAGQTVAVLGNGLSSATIWNELLRQGAKIVAIAPTSFTMNQPLNTPRKYFSFLGIMPYRYQPIVERLKELKKATRGTFPPYLKRKFNQEMKKGNITLIEGMAEHIDEMPNGSLRVTIKDSERSASPIIVDHVIAATGFMPPTTHPLIQQLMKQYRVAKIEHAMHVDDNFTIANLTQPGSICGVIGQASAWAIPCADSFGGIKIVAHTLASEIIGPEKITVAAVGQNFMQWFRLITGKKLI